jgi:hypothetical protein
MGKHEERAGDVAVDHIWTRSQVTAPVSLSSSIIHVTSLGTKVTVTDKLG